VCVCAHIHTHTLYMYIYMYIYVSYIHSYTHTHTHTHTYTHTHTHTHTSRTHKQDSERDQCHPRCTALSDNGEPCNKIATFGPLPHGPLRSCASHKRKVKKEKKIK